MSRHLALCVDDFALNQGIDDAVLALASLRRLSAVSCMVAVPRWRQASTALRALDPQQTDVGLHLDLTQHPFDPDLRGTLGQWIGRAWAGRFDRQRLNAEIAAQVDAFESALGRPPAHVDGHQHVHQFRHVRDALIDILTARYSPHQRPWLRSTLPPPGAGAKARVIDLLGGAALRLHARRARLASNQRMVGVYAFSADPDRWRQRLKAWLGAARDGDLLVCHPGFAVDDGDDPIREARHVEAAVLCSDDFEQMLTEAGVVLSRLGTGSAPRPPGDAGP